MSPLGFPLLADVNIHPQVIEAPRAEGRSIQTRREPGLVGVPDADVLPRAHGEGRVVLTHDSDFGQLAFAGAQPCVGLVHTRPGHVVPAFTKHEWT